MNRPSRFYMVMLLITLTVSACSVSFGMDGVTVPPSSGGNTGGSSSTLPILQGGEFAVVTNVIDGDTIEVEMNGQRYSVRYVGVNTPERDEPCYSDAREANRAMVSGQTVRLVRDSSNTDRYNRLLRFIYVGDTFVNAVLVQQGWAERVVYEPDDSMADLFLQLENSARSAGLGCHPTGIFDDGSITR